MDPTSRLARNLVEESKAYGYTLTILGAGALLIHHYGMPGIVQTGLYIGGALAAIAALSQSSRSVAFSPSERWAALAGWSRPQ